MNSIAGVRTPLSTGIGTQQHRCLSCCVPPNQQETEMNVNVDGKLSWEKWTKEAERAGEHYWCYAEFMHDNPEAAKSAWGAGIDPYEYILSEGERLDLNKFGKAWG